MIWHLITGEYPPSLGGVADHSAILAGALAAAGDTVHVWAPGRDGETEQDGITVHRAAGTWSGADARELTATLLASGLPANAIVQWVPHAYGRRSMNVSFCWWVRRLAHRGIGVHLLVHEPFLSFREGSWRQAAAAVVHRVMMVVVLGVAARVWVTVPAWEPDVRPWLLGRQVPIGWIPVPSSIPVFEAAAEVDALRMRLACGASRWIVGHFGTYGASTDAPLRRVIERVLAAGDDMRVVLIGRDSEEFAATLCSQRPETAGRITATGPLDAREVSLHLQACDVMLQPYIDGASSRRTTLMAALAHGRAVVTTLGRLSDPFWSDEHRVSLVALDAANASGMADAVVELARDAAQRSALGAAARRLYEARFRIDRAVTAIRSAGQG